MFSRTLIWFIWKVSFFTVTEKKEKTPPPVQKSYKVPQLRKAGLNQSRSSSGGKPEAPDITSKTYFPTLSAATNESSVSWNKR